MCFIYLFIYLFLFFCEKFIKIDDFLVPIELYSYSLCLSFGKLKLAFGSNAGLISMGF